MTRCDCVACVVLVALALASVRASAQEHTGAPSEEPAVASERGTRAELSGELFAGYGARSTDALATNEFELERGEVGIDFVWGEHFGAELRLEVIRSATAQSLAGIDGDSLVARAKRAWGYTDTESRAGRFELRAGLVPDPWIEAVESSFDLRGSGPTVGERAGLFDTSDLGAAARWGYRGGLVDVHAAVTNGEGRNQVEQNGGKNTTVVVTFRPLEFDLAGQTARIDFHLAGRDGSTGAGSSRSHRLAAAAALCQPSFGAGVELIRAYGVGDRSDRDADALGAWGNARLYGPWLGVVARAALIDQDRAAAETWERVVAIGLFTDLRDRDGVRFRVYALAEDDRFGTNAGPFPGVSAAVNQKAAMLILVARGRNAVAERSNLR